MYTRFYELKCMNGPKMNRFRIVVTQGKTFSQMMKEYNVKIPGFLDAVDNYVDNERWEITTTWESKEKYLESQKHPYRKMFWNRFEVEALKHDIYMTMTDNEGEIWEPFSDLF